MNQTALTLASAAVTGVVFLQRSPFPDEDAIVLLILAHKPWLFYVLRWGWTVMLFTTPALVFSGLFSLVFIFTERGGRQKRSQLAPYPLAQQSGPLHIVIGEVHHPRKPIPVETPGWLVGPEQPTQSRSTPASPAFLVCPET